jgi:2-oxo-hept-3-ene-1,7-dioate hydratase
MLNQQQIEDAANRLYDAERAHIQIPALTLSYPDMNMDDAYQVQKQWVERKVAEGSEVVGYKIGLTSRAMQMAVNIDTPDYGVLLDDMVFPNNGRIRAGDFTDPRIEVEFAFVLKQSLCGADVTLEQVLDATDYVVPALELIAARSFRTDPQSGYTRKVFDTIADNAANAGIVLGDTQIDPRTTDLRWAGALLYLNGNIEETGLAAGVMDHPGHGIRWVCKRFAPWGIGLEPGQIILSGSFTRPVIVTAGDHIRADYGEHGELTVDFD